MNNDPWLDHWLPLIIERANGRELLEIGCGWGLDTVVLSAAGADVLAIDLADLSRAQAAAPNAKFQQIDVREFLLTVTPGRYSVILASLSLHYLPWVETQQVIAAIYRAMASNGILLFRANSTEDVNYGAVGNPEIEAHYYQVGERAKRFFDQADIVRLFDENWELLSQEKMTIDRFERLKVVWEIVLQKKFSLI